MPVTREDVARKAGVSQPVVSYVINNGPRPVSPETRERVLAAIRELGYRANLVARSLTSQRSRTLGIIVPDAANMFYSEVAKGVEDGAYAQGYGVILGNTNGDLARQTAYVESLLARQVDAIIFVTLAAKPEELALIGQYEVPAVYIAPENQLEVSAQLRLGVVEAGFEAGGYAAGAHLLARGHRRIAALNGRGSNMSEPFQQWGRVAGFRRALNEAGVEPAIHFGGEHFEEGYQLARQIFGAGEPPSALFAGNDLLAIGALRAAQDVGLRVPEEIAICGFDDLPLAAFVNPRLTTVRVPKYEMGLQAAKLALGQLAGADLSNQDRLLVFPTELIIRQSS